ncbi:MAG: hypothetical protein AMS21_01215 [Gemmatimonas sp. SG8_38_2]|nr:MAG: hypothetical protein AMS21_01215 [Gemmatimonas sp. SG8_38_2]
MMKLRDGRYAVEHGDKYMAIIAVPFVLETERLANNDVDGLGVVVDAPDVILELQDGCMTEDNAWSGVPHDRGVYMCVVEVNVSCYDEDAEVEFIIVKADKIAELKSSGPIKEGPA